MCVCVCSAPPPHLFTAPELHITVAGTHVVCFVTNELSTGKLVVAVAVSKTGVTGPYIDVLGKPLLATSDADCYGVIDPHFFQDPA